MTEQEIKNTILEIIGQKKPNDSNWWKKVKKEQVLWDWIQSHKLVSSKKLTEEIYSALYQAEPYKCRYGNLRKDFKNIIDGYEFCSKPQYCKCYQEWESVHSSGTKAERTQEEIDVSNTTREQTILSMTNGQYTNIMQIPAVQENYRLAYKEKTGYEWPTLNPKVRKKMENTWESIYGPGITNPSYAPEIQDKIGEKLRNRTAEEKEKSRQKQLDTFRRNGKIIPETEKSEFAKYRQDVDHYTEKSWRTHRDIINIEQLNRGKEYHLDHIFSVYEGFVYDIDPEVIGHWTNLRIIPAKDNISKGANSHKTKEQLFEDFSNSFAKYI